LNWTSDRLKSRQFGLPVLSNKYNELQKIVKKALGIIPKLF
jgi:hypothetical protein